MATAFTLELSAVDEYKHSLQEIRALLTFLGKDQFLDSMGDETLTDHWAKAWEFESVEWDQERTAEYDNDEVIWMSPQKTQTIGAPIRRLFLPIIHKWSNSKVLRLRPETAWAQQEGPEIGPAAAYVERDSVIVLRGTNKELQNLREVANELVTLINREVQLHFKEFRPNVLQMIRTRRQELAREAEQFSLEAENIGAKLRSHEVKTAQSTNGEPKPNYEVSTPANHPVDGPPITWRSPELAHQRLRNKVANFRSRTEARWAVFFEALDIQWEYEQEAHVIDRVTYRPAFMLPEFHCYWEVRDDDQFDLALMSKLADVSGHSVFVVNGPPSIGLNAEVAYPGGGGDNFYQWCECPKCGKLGIQFLGRAERNRCSCYKASSDEVQSADTFRLQQACLRAYDERFVDQFIGSHRPVFSLDVKGAKHLPTDSVSLQAGEVKSPPVRVFIAYSHKNRTILNRVRVHLAPQENAGLLDIWDDRRILVGEDWKERIEVALNDAKIGLLLVSADFLASSFILNKELPTLLRAAEARGTKIVSLVVSHCRFEETHEISRFQAVNLPSKPLLTMSRAKQEEVLLKLSHDIDSILDDNDI